MEMNFDTYCRLFRSEIAILKKMQYEIMSIIHILSSFTYILNNIVSYCSSEDVPETDKDEDKIQ